MRIITIPPAMDFKPITDQQKPQYDRLVSHVIQSWIWGEFRERLGTKVLRFGLFQDTKLSTPFQLTLHKIPLVNYYVGYLPKGPFPNETLASVLTKIGRQYRCAFIKLEPNILKSSSLPPIPQAFKRSPKPLFTEYNYLLDITQSEEQILKNMHQKFRYNIKVAQKHGVWVEERTDDQALEVYLELYFATTKRQDYHGHNPHYHRLVWETLKSKGLARILIAFYQPPGQNKPIPLTAWMILNFHDTLYYPYGGSSDQHRNVMASNLIAWEAIKLGKKLGLKKFDLWGAVGPNTPANHPWQGFHRFKSQIGAELVEYIGTYDLVLNPFIYYPFTLVDRFTRAKTFLLKFAKSS